MKSITVAIKDFALPVPRVGSIEMHSGYGKTPLDAIEIHTRVQTKRKKADANYEAEVKLSCTFQTQGYEFTVVGRADGVTRPTSPDATPHIEEIKTSFSLIDLEKKLSSPTHPYVLQLLTYGYCYFKQFNVIPRLSFHLVSTRNSNSRDVEIRLEIEEYEAWLSRRLDELVVETKRTEAREKRRKKAAESFAFPFPEPRPGQTELVSTVEKRMAEKKRLLVQAPTGLGKTVGILYPALKEALQRGGRVVYVTPKNSQHAIAEDAVERFQSTGTKVRSLTITAKSKICLKSEPLCNPEYCEYAKDYYTKLDAAGISELLSKKKKLSEKVFRSLAASYEVCPFELQMEGAKDADVIICDYNYAFAPRTGLDKQDRPNLVIDEAHNLYSRALGYYSPELSTITLERMREGMRSLPLTFQMEAERLLNGCIEAIASCQPESIKNAKKLSAVEISPPHEVFLEQDSLLRAFLTRYLESDIEIQPKDPVLRLSFYWSEFTEALVFVGSGKEEFFTTFRQLPRGGSMIKITCCDASEMLKACYDDFENVVGFSATLKPFEYYAKLSGLEDEKLHVEEFSSPFPKAHRKLLVIPEISTKFSERDRNYQKVAETIRRISEVRPGNYFAFFPSFDFLEKVMEKFQPPAGFESLRQSRDMKLDDVNLLLERLKVPESPVIVFAVQGGMLSEGIDYPGDILIGAFVVGPPLPMFELEREKMREFYEKKYGSGFDYAYSYPAMAKAIQAAGRVIRSETDRGLIVLMDNRFLTTNFSKSMPGDWFEKSPSELVSSAILKEVREFWES